MVEQTIDQMLNEINQLYNERGQIKRRCILAALNGIRIAVKNNLIQSFINHMDVWHKKEILKLEIQTCDPSKPSN